MAPKAVKSLDKKIETVEFNKQIIQVEARFSVPGYIANNFSFQAISGMALDHLGLNDPDAKKKKKDPKVLEVEVEGKIVRDPEGRVCILARHIMDGIVDALPLAVDQGEARISKFLLRCAMRVEGIDYKHFCPISFKEEDFITRLDHVVQGGMNKVTNTCFRPEFRNALIRFNVIFLPRTISEKSVITFLSYCSEAIGLGAWTPGKSGNFGLFTSAADGKFIKKNEPVKQPKVNAKLIQEGFERFIREAGADRVKELLAKFGGAMPLAA